MNIKAILNVVGILLILLAGILLVPLAVSVYYRHPVPGHMSDVMAFAYSIGISGLLGLVLWKTLPSGIENLRDREGFAIVAFSWLAISLIGALPFYLTGVCPNFVDAFFESMSGFTTTGATILTDIESVPHGLLFWRNMSQWLGGMGIIMLSLAILPALGIGSFHLFKAEVPGGSSVERVQPRLAETAKILWKVYFLLTILEILLLRLAGVELFDSVCITFSTVATGGFAPYNTSIAVFNNVYIESIVTLFMFLGGVNFALHWQLFHFNARPVYENPELRFFIFMIASTILFATWGLMEFRHIEGTEAFRKAAFTVVSIGTTTGFVTDDFNEWPNFLRITLLALMMIGGCAGSTSGSLKAIRFIILVKVIFRQLQKLIHPRAVIHVKVGNRAISQEHMLNVVGLTVLFGVLTGFSAIYLSALGLDLTTAVSASIASLFNIGPGLGMVGATGDYAEIPTQGKWWIIFCMLMGRLEVYGVLMLFLPMVWKK